MDFYGAQRRFVAAFELGLATSFNFVAFPKVNRSIHVRINDCHKKGAPRDSCIRCGGARGTTESNLLGALGSCSAPSRSVELQVMLEPITHKNPHIDEPTSN
jgi:hypothetical protein